MSDHTKQSVTTGNLRQQRERRARINRIKTGIILFIVIWMVLCMTISIYLGVRIHSLQKQIDLLTENTLNRVITIDSNADGSTQNDDESSPDHMEQASDAADEAMGEQPATEANAAIRECLLPEDNRLEDGEQPTVFLTFDDGPSENTEKILEVLDKYHVKATFFVTGKEGEDAEQRYRRIAEGGHTLAMHSYSHKYSSIYESKEAFAEDFNKLRQKIVSVTGEQPTIYRFPGGSSNQVSNTDMNEFIDFLGEQGMTYYDWNVVCGDATSQIYTAEELAQNVMTDVVRYKYSVVLMHDAADKDSTVAALDLVLQELTAMGARVLPITDDSPVIHHRIG
ncbi:MAG: polysaccharide deacetylase [bacterium]|nr:polysaccharide deacetylase [bacterium]